MVRYELPHVHGLNFVLDRALGGGVSMTLRVDPHGKSFQSLVLDIDRSEGAVVIESSSPTQRCTSTGRWSSGDGARVHLGRARVPAQPSRRGGSPTSRRPTRAWLPPGAAFDAHWRRTDTGGAGNGAAPARRPAGEAPRGAGPARHRRGRLADLPGSHPADRDTGGELPVGGRRRRVRTAGWLPRAAARPGWCRRGSRASCCAYPIGVVTAITPYNYPINMIAWKVAPCARGRLLRRPAAVPARGAVLGRLRPAGRRGRRAARCAQPRRRAARTSVQRLSGAPGRRPGDVHRVQRYRRRRCRGGRADCTPRSCSSSAASRRPWSSRAPTSTRAVGPSMLRFCRNAGQGCGATTRILVHRDEYDEFVDAAVAFLRERAPVGDPTQRGDRGRSADQRRAPRPRGGLPASSRRPRRDPPHRRRPPRPSGASSWSRRWSPTSTRPTRSARTSCSPPWRDGHALRHRRRGGRARERQSVRPQRARVGRPRGGPRRGAPPGDGHRRHQRRRRCPAGRPVDGFQAVRCRERDGRWTASPSSSPCGTCSGRRSDTEAARPQPRPRRRLAGRTVGRGAMRAGRSSRGRRSRVAR